jgi:hypothetical protein
MGNRRKFSSDGHVVTSADVEFRLNASQHRYHINLVTEACLAWNIERESYVSDFSIIAVTAQFVHMLRTILPNFQLESHAQEMAMHIYNGRQIKGRIHTVIKVNRIGDETKKMSCLLLESKSPGTLGIHEWEHSLYTPAP